MEAPANDAADALTAPTCRDLVAPAVPLEPCPPTALRVFVLGGENDSDACERVLAQAARIEAALDLEIGDGLAALCVGDRLISLGFSNVGD